MHEGFSRCKTRNRKREQYEEEGRKRERGQRVMRLYLSRLNPRPTRTLAGEARVEGRTIARIRGESRAKGMESSKLVRN